MKKADGWNIFEQAQITDNTRNLTDYCDNINLSWGEEEWLDNNNSSFCRSWLTEWIFIDKFWNDEYLKYSTLNLDSDFIIEMNVQIPEFDWEKHYLIHSWYNTATTSDDIKLYIQDWKLYLNPSDVSDYKRISNTSWNFANIKLKKSLNYIKAIHWSLETTTKSFTSTIDNFLIWSFYYSPSIYKYQINSIIDYVKIYK